MSDEEFEERISWIKSKINSKRYISAKKELDKLITKSSTGYSRLAYLNGLLGYYFYSEGEMDKAIIAYEHAQSYYVKNLKKNIKKIIEIKNSLGMLYNIQKKYASALSVLSSSAMLAHNYGVKDTSTNNNIGVVYQRLGNYEKAIEYYDLGLSNFFSSTYLDSAKIFTSFLNKARILLKQNKLGHTTLILDRLSQIMESCVNLKIKENYLVAQALLNFKKEEILTALKYCDAVIDLNIGDSNSHYLVSALLLKGEILCNQGNKDESYNLLYKAYSLSSSIYMNRKLEVLKIILFFHERYMEYEKGQEIILKIFQLKAQKDKEGSMELLDVQEKFENDQKNRSITSGIIFNRKIRSENKKLENAIDKQRYLDLHLRSLQLQLSPHFIFNTLQSIQGFIFQKDALATSDYLAKFANLMRSVLNASKKDKISLAEEIDMLETYLELEQKRFLDKFEYQLDVAGVSNFQTEYLPSLLVQPFIENAIIHGFSTKNKGRLNVVFRKDKTQLYIHVIDNGIGRVAANLKKKEHSNGCSTALKIMEERQEYSSESNNFKFKYKIFDRNTSQGRTGTHVVLQVLDLAENV